MPIIRLPAAANLSFPEFAEDLRLRGFTILSVSAERIEALAPVLVQASPLYPRWWLIGTMTFARSATGIVISHRLSRGRIAASSLVTGAIASTTFPAALSVRLAIGGAAALGMALWQTFGMRREPTILEFTP